MQENSFMEISFKHLKSRIPVPSTFEDLKSVIFVLFKESLPKKWVLQYEDEVEEYNILDGEVSYKQLLHSSSNALIKISIGTLAEERKKEVLIGKKPIQRKTHLHAENQNNYFANKSLLKKMTAYDLPLSLKTEYEIKYEEITKNLSDDEKEKLEQKKKKYIARAQEFKKSLIQLVQNVVLNEIKKNVKTNNGQLSLKIAHPVHSNISCNKCNSFPITGVRYKCSGCNYDLCESCEGEDKEHPHSFIKIKTPL